MYNYYNVFLNTLQAHKIDDETSYYKCMPVIK